MSEVEGLKQKIEQLFKKLRDNMLNRDSETLLVKVEKFDKLQADVVAVLEEAKQDIIQHLIKRPKIINQEWFKWESELESKLVKHFGVLRKDGEGLNEVYGKVV